MKAKATCRTRHVAIRPFRIWFRFFTIAILCKNITYFHYMCWHSYNSLYITSDMRTHHCFSTFLFRSQTVNLSAVMQHPPRSLFPLLSKSFQCDSVFFMLHLGITAREHPGHSLIHPLLHSLTIGQALGSPEPSHSLPPRHIPFQILRNSTSRTHFIWHHILLWTCHFTSLISFTARSTCYCPKVAHLPRPNWEVFSPVMLL